MKKLLFLFLLFIPFAAFCQNKKKQKLVTPSRWREIVRMLPDSTNMQFRDTLFMSFQLKDSFSYHYKNGFIYEGVFTVSEDSILDLGTERFKVVHVLNMPKKPALMVLANARGIYHFAIDSSPLLKAIVIEKEDTATPVTNIDVMIGRWIVYKRVAKGPGHIDPSDNIRSIYITGPSTDGKLGYVYSGSDADNNPSWHIKSFGVDQALICGGKNPRTLQVLRCQNGEMIIEEEEIKYYFKMYK